MGTPLMSLVIAGRLRSLSYQKRPKTVNPRITIAEQARVV